MKNSKLLTPDDEKIKTRISNKIRLYWTKKSLERRKYRLKEDCSHPSVSFFEEDFTFRCMKCNKKLVKINGKDEFNLFCELSEIDPKSLIP